MSRVSGIDQMMADFRSQLQEVKSEKRKETERLRMDLKCMQLTHQKKTSRVRELCAGAQESIKDLLKNYAIDMQQILDQDMDKEMLIKNSNEKKDINEYQGKHIEMIQCLLMALNTYDQIVEFMNASEDKNINRISVHSGSLYSQSADSSVISGRRKKSRSRSTKKLRSKQNHIVQEVDEEQERDSSHLTSKNIDN